MPRQLIAEMHARPFLADDSGAGERGGECRSGKTGFLPFLRGAAGARLVLPRDECVPPGTATRCPSTCSCNAAMQADICSGHYQTCGGLISCPPTESSVILSSGNRLPLSLQMHLIRELSRLRVSCFPLNGLLAAPGFSEVELAGVFCNLVRENRGK